MSRREEKSPETERMAANVKEELEEEPVLLQRCLVKLETGDWRKMHFKITESINNGKRILSTVPAQWEDRGTLYRPRKNESTLKTCNSWMPCILKRSDPHYETSEREGSLVSDTSDSDREIVAEHSTRRPHKSNTVIPINVKDLGTRRVVETSSVEKVQEETRTEPVSEIDLPNFILMSEPRDQAVKLEVIPGTSIEKAETMEEKVDLLISMASANAANVTLLFDNQQKILQQIALLSNKLQQFISPVSVPIAQNRRSNNLMDFNTISNLQELTNFEENLCHPEIEENFIKTLSITCTKERGRGYNNAYSLIDAMFSRQFMTQCSWAGGTRGEPKVCFKSFTKTIMLFFKVIHGSDDTFTKPDCENFLKKVMRNAIKRSESKMLRVSAQKRRPKKAKVL